MPVVKIKRSDSSNFRRFYPGPTAAVCNILYVLTGAIRLLLLLLRGTSNRSLDFCNRIPHTSAGSGGYYGL